jgi:hypothetical protein
MPTRTKDQNSYTHGSWNALCDVCGFKFKSCDLKKRWDGLMVCKEDWEPRHESDFFRAPTEDQSVDWVRSDDSEQAVGGNTDISDNTFPPVKNTDATGQGTKPDTDADGLVEGDFLEYDAEVGTGEANSGTVTKAS